MFRKENGVTLVALVITIIVLLILAGVTISMVLGDDGILGNAQNAVEQYTVSDMKETASIAAATLTTNYLADKYDSEAGVEDESPNALNGENLATQIYKLISDKVKVQDDVEVSGDNVEVEMKNGDTFTIPFTVNVGKSIVIGTITGEVAGKPVTL